MGNFVVEGNSLEVVSFDDYFIADYLYDVYIDKKQLFSLMHVNSAPRLSFSNLYHGKLCFIKMAVSTTKQVKIPVANTFTCNYTMYFFCHMNAKMQSLKHCHLRNDKKKAPKIKFLGRVHLNGDTKTFHPLTDKL